MKNITTAKEQLNACFGVTVTDQDLVTYAEKWRKQAKISPFSPINTFINALNKDYIYVDTDGVKTAH